MGILAPRHSRVLAILLSSDKPLETLAIAGKLKLDRKHTCNLLNELRVMGRADTVRGGNRTSWWDASRAQELLARDPLYGLATRTKRAVRQVMREADDAEDTFLPKQRIVPAAGAPRLRPAGPVSVFDLAGG